MDGGVFLFKFLLDITKLSTMSPDMVWKLLYFVHDPHFTRRLEGEVELTDR